MRLHIRPTGIQHRAWWILVDSIVFATFYVLVFSAMLWMLGGCTVRQQRIASYATLGFAEGAIACDWRQTHDAAAGGWHHQYEANEMLGTNPSVGHVDAWMAGAAVTTAIVGRLLPLRFRPFLYGAVAVWETHIVAGNLPQTGTCL